MPRIPRIRKPRFPDQMFMHRETGRLSHYNIPPEDWGRIYPPDYIPVQGPELPLNLEERRQRLRDAQEAYEEEFAEERARQMENRRRMAQAVEMRKNELWRQYIEDVDPAHGFGWPRGKSERLDEEFENQANWDVRGMNEEGYTDAPDWDFREYYKDAPWRMW